MRTRFNLLDNAAMSVGKRWTPRSFLKRRWPSSSYQKGLERGRGTTFLLKNNDGQYIIDLICWIIMLCLGKEVDIPIFPQEHEGMIPEEHEEHEGLFSEN